MIDITGLDYDQIEAFVLSRYAGEATAAERMASSSSNAADPFAAIAAIRPQLEQFAQDLRERSPQLSSDQVIFALTKQIRRSD